MVVFLNTIHSGLHYDSLKNCIIISNASVTP